MTSTLLVTNSNTGSHHIFNLKGAIEKTGGRLSEDDKAIDDKSHQNNKSKVSFLGVFSKYFQSEWSFARYKTTDLDTKVAFSQDKYFYILGSKGTFYIVNYQEVKENRCHLEFEAKV
eukprot:CAMPEP_0114581670 /NCGR_PEP_ID=MMETSP0125-20121206/5755_1 /TAXON_ID=485358 ORGANISM="Aristerostoma sp., Strain ATCC 50986" /NCGR_SAMPLE_ID=MMETSP0125 /ASSEMBLY_ACC=CAM_ASM_000245 /LENGTH=116 /DNA_ID=CAMNT_0001774063 /DNA_START=697 /DNA_END=1047 /DNA_ORIENTATION=-